MAKIIKYDNSCKLLDEHDPDVIKALDFQLSYKILGAEFSRAFKGYINERGEEITWNGRKHLLESNLRFPLGLLERVVSFYHERRLPIEVEDQRRLISQASPIDIITKLASTGKTPYHYQIDAVNTAKTKNRGIIRVATGGGKTIIAALLTAELGKSTIIYVIGKDLLYQIHKLFSSLFDEEIGIIGDGKCEIRRINIATIWSVGIALDLDDAKIADDEGGKEAAIKADKFRDIKTMLLDARVHILDECHLASCETIQTIAHNVKAEHFFGMSASPWRDDNSDILIEAVLGNRIVDISAKYLIENGFLVKPIIRFLAVPQYHTNKRSNYKNIYKNYVTMNTARNEMITKAATKLVEQGYKTLVLFHTKAHGKILEKMISAKIPCGILSGDDDIAERNEVCRQLESGEINCIIASKIFDIGVDLPALSALVIASGGKSSVRALQRVGRVIRKYKGKTQAPVIDFADQAPYLIEHAETRRDILREEFEVSWPEEK